MPSRALQRHSLHVPLDSRHVLPAIAVILTSSTLIYYYYSSEAKRKAFEAVRRRHISLRDKRPRSEDKYSSLRIQGKFANPFLEWRDVRWWETVLFWLGKLRGNSIPSNEKDLSRVLPIHKPSLDLLFPSPSADRPSSTPSSTPSSIQASASIIHSLTDSWVDAAIATASAPASGFTPASSSSQQDSGAVGPMTFSWLGQSTCFVTMDGINILTDPVFSPRIANSWFGPKRVRPLPCELGDLKHIDFVLVSHNHRDHLDEQVVHQLNNKVTWYIPMGLRDWFVRRGVYNVIELDWWQEIHHKERPDIVIAAVPCMHSSGRAAPYDSNRSLWCGFVVKSQQHSFFHCGTGGYSPDLYKAIGEKYMPITVAALPIGGYEPQWYMRHVHMSPDDALAAHFALGRPRLTVGVHWGTFMLSLERYTDPPRRFTAAAEKLSVRDEVQCVGLGMTIIVPEGRVGREVELELEAGEDEYEAGGASEPFETETIELEMDGEEEGFE
ncbi:beta-lactamase superfamily domain-containing protein [Endogone sp. FLAS-F59071]|nr:beta-lactamase superfamily domain-containing protein [Endogone sp. FLAS-F59071]|eukprot:RUS22194.1 beta-lactamase superfamily domain-containing protein [Endogone sp. FLAS-F59071]